MQPNDVTWPAGFGTPSTDGLKLNKNTDEWNDIFEAFKTKVEADNGGIILTKDEVDSITLVPYKVSRYNSTGGSYHVDCDVVIKCNFVTVDFMVKNDSDNFASILNGKITCPKGQAFPKDKVPPAPEKDGYEFDGWYTNEEFKEKADFNTKLTEDTTFYGKYEPVKTYTVTYTDGVGGEVFKDQVTSGLRKGTDTPAFNGDTPTRKGYEFKGWNPTVAKTVTEDATYTAQWTKDSSQWFNVKYDANGGTGTVSDNTEYLSGTEVTVMDGDGLKKDGYDFTGWNTEANGNGTAYAKGNTFEITGNTTLYAQWKAKEYSFTVNYLWNGGEIQAPTTGDNAMHGDKITITDTSIDGYTLIPSQQTSMTIGTGENVLNLNYYKNVTLTANSDTKTYDGTEHTVTGYTAKDNKDNLVEGLTFTGVASPSASGTDVGEYDVEFSGSAVGAHNELYIVTAVNPGKLTINKRSVTLTSETASKAYDGTPLTKPEVKVTGDGFVEGEVTDIRATGSVTHVSEGEVTNTIKYTPTDKFKADNYDITKTEGKLTITPVTDKVTVTITGNTKTVRYNGKEQTVEGYTVSIDNKLYTADDFTFSGNAKATGTDADTYYMGLKDEQFTNNNNNFKNVKFVVTDGTLTITKAPTYTFDLNDPDTITVNKKFVSKYGRSATMSFEATATIEKKEAYIITDSGINTNASNSAAAAKSDYTKVFEAAGMVTLKTDTTDVFKFSGKYDLEPGDYRITVKEAKGSDRYYVTYDDTTYTYDFTVNNEGKINIDTPITCTFTNVYTKRHTAATPSKPTLNTGDHYAYVMGYPDGTVRPNGSITRAEVSAILFRLLSDKTRDEYFTTESSFTDVKAGAWYNNSIATLEKAGVIVDTAKGGAFRPNEAITRAELAAMLAQFSDAKPVKGVKFSDVSAEHWAYEAIAIAAKMGWIEGYPDGTFRPDATITRAEMMTLVNRALERVPSDEDHLLSKRVMLTFPDCKSGDWFYIAVQEATNSHTYERAATEKNGDEQWTALRANRDWTQLEK